MYLDKKLVNTVIDISLNAGELILNIYHKKNYNIKRKGDLSPVTDADFLANNYICNKLKNLELNYPIVSEETYEENWSIRKNWDRYWLVDPLDGTKEFIKKTDEFTVNIALIEHGEPILGVVFAPALSTLYWGAYGKGAWLRREKNEPVILNCRAHYSGELWKVVSSRSHPSPHMAEYLSSLGDYELVPMGSSLKICAVASGKAHIYPRLGPTCEWDTAAAHAVVRAAGGDIFDLEGNPLRYNQKDSLLNPHFIVRSN